MLERAQVLGWHEELGAPGMPEICRRVRTKLIGYVLSMAHLVSVRVRVGVGVRVRVRVRVRARVRARVRVGARFRC